MPNKKTSEQKNFVALLADVKQHIQAAQTRAILAVNSELVRLYWDVGRMIDARQKRAGWGAAVVPRLAAELKNDLPELKGFSERNIGRMIAFYREYPRPDVILPQAAAKLAASEKARLSGKHPASYAGDSLLWSIPWFHHIMLMQKVKDLNVRRWYMEQTLVNGWSRNMLAMQIEVQVHARHGRTPSNFALTLPERQSDLVQQTLKDPYIFDFLTLTEPFQERELETALVRHLEKFLLELGQGFAFVGRQYKVEVGDEDFYIDLLFYHLPLCAFVVIELKKGKFKPEYAGKLNFYCSVVNDRLKRPSDNPTIGLILCQERERLLAEYSLSGIDKPIGVSTYELTRALPKEMTSALPSVEEIEVELSNLTNDAPKRPHANPDQCGEDHGEYKASGVRIVDHPFDAADGAETPFGRRWGGDTIILAAEQIAALEAGKTLALDVQSEYVAFLMTDAVKEKRPKRRKGGQHDA